MNASTGWRATLRTAEDDALMTGQSHLEEIWTVSAFLLIDSRFPSQVHK